MHRTVVAVMLSLLFAVVGFALVVPVASAQGECGTEGQPACPPPPTCGTEGQPACPPPACGTEGQPACPPPPTCGTEGQPACQCGTEGQPECPPPAALCHNIGGPRGLGANCDGTGTCSFVVGGVTMNVAAGQFLGIIIHFNQANAGAVAAHVAHGDGPILATFNPPLHLASKGQRHRAANVSCLGQRIVPQPPEPGN
jgi:hypothetical protein